MTVGPDGQADGVELPATLRGETFQTCLAPALRMASLRGGRPVSETPTMLVSLAE